jgi:hypothetical protein
MMQVFQPRNVRQDECHSCAAIPFFPGGSQPSDRNPRFGTGYLWTAETLDLGDMLQYFPPTFYKLPVNIRVR